MNFITAHDGFTLLDLVSYNHRHNEANGENNCDGEDHNRSWDCGAKGETDTSAVVVLTEQQRRNLMTPLLLSQGAPMLVAGYEMGRTQFGNKNTYCQNSPISWLILDVSKENQVFLDYTCQLINFLLEYPIFCRRQ